MIVPIRDKLYAQDDTKANGKIVGSLEALRAELLEHHLLHRFAWIYKGGEIGSTEEKRNFQYTLISRAARDSYSIELVTLAGPDHMDNAITRGLLAMVYGVSEQFHE
jgi:hypothetical protein